MPWALPDDQRVNEFCASWFDRGVAMASYRPMGSEADPAPLETLARNVLTFVGYPRIDSDGAMRFYTRGPSRSFVRSANGIEEPGPDAWPLSDPTVILLPLIAFDRTGTRLGQGGGHYDRALAAIEAANLAQFGEPLLFKIGIAWSVQEIPALPRESWDIPLDAVITEREWIDIR